MSVVYLFIFLMIRLPPQCTLTDTLVPYTTRVQSCLAPLNGLRPCPDITSVTKDQVHGNRDSEYLFKKRRKGGRSQGIAAQSCEAAGQVCSGVFYAHRSFDRLEHLVLHNHEIGREHA